VGESRRGEEYRGVPQGNVSCVRCIQAWIRDLDPAAIMGVSGADPLIQCDGLRPKLWLLWHSGKSTKCFCSGALVEAMTMCASIPAVRGRFRARNG
jgi:hypothetical protein